jgi:parallel beta-helix repeat protein
LPNLTDAGTIIDGTSQPGNGYSGDGPKIIVDGSQLGSGYGFYITGSACQLWGLFITGFPYHGVSVTSTGSGFVIGKSFKGNVISGNNEYGILVDGADNGYIQGNRIGSGADGISDLGNGYSGIILQGGADYNFIGGAGSAGNIISGKSYYGMSIQCSSHNFIRGNKIGTEISGVVPLPNEYGGIYIGFSGSNYTCFATGNIVGGSNIGDENIIAYNFYYGVNICGDHVDFNTVQPQQYLLQWLRGIESY